MTADMLSSNARHCHCEERAARRSNLRTGWRSESLMAVQQQAGVAGQNPLSIRAQRANLSDEFHHARGVPDFLRIIGAENATRCRQLDERRLHRLDLAA